MYDLRRAVLADLWALPGVRPFLEGATETTTGAVVWAEDEGSADILVRMYNWRRKDMYGGMPLCIF